MRNAGWIVASAAHVPARLSGAVSRKLLKSGVTGAGLFFFIIIIFLQIYGAMEVCPVRSKEASWRKLRSQARLACLEKSTLALCDGILP